MMDMDVQSLINNGMAWRLEGSVGRACMDALESGYAILGPELVEDYYGNVVPARYMVKEGSKGSIEYANALREGRGAEPLTEEQWDAGEGATMDCNHVETIQVLTEEGLECLWCGKVLT